MAGGVMHSDPQSVWVRTRREFPMVRLRNIDLHAVTEAQTVQHIIDCLNRGVGGTVITPNLDIVRQCQKDMRFRALVQEADLCVPDGRPLIWASRLQGTPLPERVAGSDLISSLSAAAADAGKSIYLLGGAPGVAEIAADVLKQRKPDLKIAGMYCPDRGFEQDPEKIREIGRIIRDARPDIVFTALGSPKQEILTDQIRRYAPQAWWLGVGAAFSFLAGEVQRAPRWMQRIGLEWVHRLSQEPKRLFKRYILQGVPFAAGLLIGCAVRGSLRLILPLPSPVTPRQAAKSAPASPAASPRRRTAPTQVDLRAGEPRAAVGNEEAPEVLRHIRAMVLLSGQLRPSELVSRTGRSLLDLPLDANGSLMVGWLRQAQELADRLQLPNLPVRVLVAKNSPEPDASPVREFGSLRVERDLSEYRGTGGVIGDLAADFADDDVLLVANASQVMLEPMWQLVQSLGRLMGDVALLAHADGTPSTFMLLRCKALRVIPRLGFVDMKEQALPEIARLGDVRVLQRQNIIGAPLRSLSDYIAALRQYHRKLLNGQTTIEDPLEEDYHLTFKLIEDGADVDPSARIHDSVILKGARVEADAVVARSIVSAGAVVRREGVAVEQMISPLRGNGSHRNNGPHANGTNGFPALPAPASQGSGLGSGEAADKLKDRGGAQ